MKDNSKFWCIYLVAFGAVSLIIGSILAALLPGWCFFFGPLIYLVVTAFMIKAAWVQIPHNHVRLVTVRGAYKETWKSGIIHIRFPLLGLVEEAAEVFLGEQMMELNLDEAVTTGYGDGKVDFQDGSAPVVVYVYFKITCPEKAVFGISDVYRAISEKMDGAVRSYLADLTIDEANELKDQLIMARVLNFDSVRRDANGNIVKGADGRPEFMHVDESAPADIPLWNHIEGSWGVSISSLVISDIKLSAEVIAMREKLMLAKIEAEAAETQAKKTITEAEAAAQKKAIETEANFKAANKNALAERNALEKRGEGLRKGIEHLTAAAGGDKRLATTMFLREKLIGTLGDKTVYITSGRDTGLEFGLGIGEGMKRDRGGKGKSSHHTPRSAAAPAAAAP